ncbi:uncharacterized protein [Kogia breviceps]|uniref:uncharacterized protein n=1 Tax=Kogia breviceps TaxID=27615 RepID=UPI0034D1BF43
MAVGSRLSSCAEGRGRGHSVLCPPWSNPLADHRPACQGPAPSTVSAWPSGGPAALCQRLMPLEKGSSFSGLKQEERKQLGLWRTFPRRQGRNSHGERNSFHAGWSAPDSPPVSPSEPLLGPLRPGDLSGDCHGLWLLEATAGGRDRDLEGFTRGQSTAPHRDLTGHATSRAADPFQDSRAPVSLMWKQEGGPEVQRVTET